MSVTERDMLDALLGRYTAVRRGSIADRWVRAEHMSSALGHYPKRVADFVAADKYPRTMAFHGHEVKVSRSDWLTELRDPNKAAAFVPYMHHWWLVVPDVSIVRRDELPEGWGLMTLGDSGLRAKVVAPRREPLPMPTEMAIAFAAAAGRTASREPLRRDASVAYVDNWDPRCSACGELGPCPLHQPRAVSVQQAAS